MEEISRKGDSLPCHYLEGPAPTIAGIVFRVGQADERLPARGLTHLVEHAALWAVGERPFGLNGQVDLISTTFFAQGTTEQIESFATDIGAALTALPVERVSTEARVLRLESARAQSGPAEVHLALRFGARAYGLAHYRQLGLGSLGGAEAAAWSRYAFVADNVACWVVGPEEPDFRLMLPPGERLPLPPLAPVLPTPRAVVGDPGSVSLSGLGGRSAAAIFGVRLAARAAQRRLRRERGITYTVIAGYQPLSADGAHLLLSADVEDPHAREVMLALVQTLDDLAEGRHDPADRAALVDEAAAAVNDPRGAPGRAQMRALDGLLGRPVASDEELIDEYRHVTPDAIADVARAWLASALLIAPAAAGDAPNAWGSQPDATPSVPRGRLFALRGTRPWNQHRHPRFDVSDQAIRFSSPGNEVAIAWPDVAAGVWESSGTRVLIALDGSRLTIEPRKWIRGDMLVAEVDRRVPRGAWCSGSGLVPPALPPALRARPYVEL